MLVLSRKSQESIVIGGNIRVTIIKTGPGVVRLGIEAPTDVAVHRAEVQQQIDQQRLGGRKRVSLDPVESNLSLRFISKG